MKVRFWGVRGSIPVPGADTVRYGGNTTCIEVQTDAGEVIILDGGTGIRSLGLSLMASPPVAVHLFITHTHWDHIQGLPFFVPFFVPGNRVSILGAFDPVYGKSLHEILAGQMEYCYFPVRENELNAEIKYDNLHDGQVVQVGSARVTAVLMNHPVMDFGYRIEADGKSVFFTGDHEPVQNLYSPGEDGYEELAEMIAARDAGLHAHMAEVDLLIADSMYTSDEYLQRAGWGHGTFDSSLQLARRVRARKLAFTHHDPQRTDDALDEIAAGVMSRRVDSDPELVFAREGMVIEV